MKISGSIVPIIMGVNKYTSLLDLYLRIKNGEVVEQNDSMTLGLTLESRIIEYSWIEGVQQYEIKHKENEDFTGTIDVWDENERMVYEIKTTKSKNEVLPIEYWIQVQWYLMLLRSHGIEARGKVLVYEYDLPADAMLRIIKDIPNYWLKLGVIKTYEVDYNEEISKQMLDRAFWFLDCLKNNILPVDPPISEAKRIYTEVVEGSICELDEVYYKKLQRMIELKKRMKAIEKEIETIELELLNYAQNNETLFYGGEPVARYKIIETTRLDTGLLKKEHPEIYRSFLKSVKYKRLMLEKNGIETNEEL